MRNKHTHMLLGDIITNIERGQTGRYLYIFVCIYVQYTVFVWKWIEIFRSLRNWLWCESWWDCPSYDDDSLRHHKPKSRSFVFQLNFIRFFITWYERRLVRGGDGAGVWVYCMVYDMLVEGMCISLWEWRWIYLSTIGYSIVFSFWSGEEYAKAIIFYVFLYISSIYIYSINQQTNLPIPHLPPNSYFFYTHEHSQIFERETQVTFVCDGRILMSVSQWICWSWYIPTYSYMNNWISR